MSFNVKNFGPIQDVSVELGDMTILIGEQASGKSLFLQLFKLAKDSQAIIRRLDNYGFIVKGNTDNLLNKFFGQGLYKLWKDNTIVEDDHTSYRKNSFSVIGRPNVADKVFYIPAQRILCLSDGRPKHFMEYSENDPYVLRQFSEVLRLFMQSGLGGSNVIYPLKNRLKRTIKDHLDNTIFHDGKVIVDTTNGQRRIAMDIDDIRLPFMTMSAGQKEFMPLLLAFYCLSGPPQNVINRSQYEYIILEEPEMGLHPMAIQTIILQLIEFLHAGYKVIISTHSSVFLEFVWAYNNLRHKPEEQRIKALCELFNVRENSSAQEFLNDVYQKDIRTYFFSRVEKKVRSIDISTLDANSDQSDIVDWGGLTQFSSRTVDVVARYNNSED